MKNKRNFCVDYLNIVFNYTDDVFKEDEKMIFRFAEFLELDLGNLKEGNGVYGYEKSLRGNGILIAWKELGTVLYSFSGSACADLAFSEKERLKTILEGVKTANGWVSRIDIAMDVADNTVFSLDYFIKKLENLEYTSKKRRFNVISEKDGSGNPVGQTVYLGNARADAGSKGNIYLRVYRKDLELKSRGAQIPTWAQGSNSIDRFEVSAGGKRKTDTIVSAIIADDGVLENVFLSLLSGMITFKIKDEKDNNKARWETDKKWVAFLQNAQALQISEPSDKTIISTLDWLNKSVVPSLAFLSKLSKEKKVDFMKILKSAIEKEIDLNPAQEKMRDEVKNTKSDNFRSLLKGHLEG